MVDVTAVHDLERPFVCDVCEIRFARRFDMECAHSRFCETKLTLTLGGILARIQKRHL